MHRKVTLMGLMALALGFFVMTVGPPAWASVDHDYWMMDTASFAIDTGQLAGADLTLATFDGNPDIPLLGTTMDVAAAVAKKTTLCYSPTRNAVFEIEPGFAYGASCLVDTGGGTLLGSSDFFEFSGVNLAFGMHPYRLKDAGRGHAPTFGTVANYLSMPSAKFINAGAAFQQDDTGIGISATS